MIRHVLLAFPIHLLATTNPPKGTLELIKKYVARFFWSGQNTGGKYHWTDWNNLCYLYNEGGANFRCLADTCHAFQAKQWWRLRTTNSLWKEFMEAKFFHNKHPSVAQWNSGQPQNWKYLCNIKEDVESNILWNIGDGDVSFWYDNWTGMGPLHQLVPDRTSCNEIKVKDIINNGS